MAALETLPWFLAVVALVQALSFFLLGRREQSRIADTVTGRGRRGKSGSLLWQLADWYEATHWGKKVRLTLAQADVKMRPFDYISFQVLIGVGVLFVAYYVVAAPWEIAWSLALASAKYGLYLYLVSRRRARVTTFEAKLPDAVTLLANTLRAGMSLPQGLKSILGDLEGPVRGVFEAVVRKMQMGGTFEAAVQEQLEVMPSRELRVLLAAIAMQREAGGNLVACLTSMGETLRERKQLLQDMRVQTAETKFVALILPILPVSILVLLNMFFPGFLQALFNPAGMIVGGIFLTGILLSMLLIRNVTKFEV